MIFPLQAAEIAARYMSLPDPHRLRTIDGKAARVNAYGLSVPLEACWVVYLPRSATMRSSEVVLVHKRTGEILYHDSPRDEG